MSQVVLITGCSSGIGRGLAEGLARHGFHVFASMRDVKGRNAAAAGELTALAQAEKLALEVLEMDITDDNSVQTAVQQLIQQTGRVDVLINNAGRGLLGLAEGATVADAQKLFDTNVFGTLRVLQAVLPHMRSQKSGYLIYISSVGATIVYPFLTLYGASKAAFDKMAEGFHYELYLLGIDTTIVQSGMYNTAFGHNSAFSDQEAELSAAYGLVGQVSQGFAGGLTSVLASPAAGKPADMADALAECIRQSSDKRPLHLPLGPFSEPAEVFNPVLEPLQKTTLEGLQLGVLLQRP